MRKYGIVAAISLCALLAGCGHVVSREMHIGTVIMAKDSGFFNKTHEMEIVRGGMSGGTGSFSTAPFFATVTDEGEWQTVQAYAQSQTELRVYATCTFFSPWSSDNNSCFVTKIEPEK